MIPAVVMFSSLPVECFIAHKSAVAQRAQVFQLVAIFLHRMPGDEETENFFLVGQAHVLVPVGRVGQTVVVVAVRFFLLEDAEQAVLARLRVALRFLRASMALSSTAISCARRPRESMAPLLISDSSTRLFSSRRSTFSQNS